jgi:hypothetical protein
MSRAPRLGSIKRSTNGKTAKDVRFDPIAFLKTAAEGRVVSTHPKKHIIFAIGKPDGVFAQPKTGLGTGIVKALAKQLDAKLITLSSPRGTTVTITHATFAAGIRAA